jgi:carboxymethylenebutenolidase
MLQVASTPVATRRVALVSPRGAFEGALAAPSQAPWRSAVVVVGRHRAVDAHVREVTRRLAEAGHGALGIGQSPLCVSRPASVDVTVDVDAALAHLRTEAGAAAPRFGVVGYGPGGFTALVAGYRSRVGAAISFYGEGPMRLESELARIIDRPRRHAASMVLLVGGNDRGVGPAALAAIRDRLQIFGMKHTLIIYPRMDQGFACPGDPAYREEEASDAWQRVLLALETAARPRNRVLPRRPLQG